MSLLYTVVWLVSLGFDIFMVSTVSAVLFTYPFSENLSYRCLSFAVRLFVTPIAKIIGRLEQ